jgi:hypothetical protein
MPDTRARRRKHAQETRPEPEPEPEPPRRSQVNPAGGCRARPRSGSAVWTGFWRRRARVRAARGGVCGGGAEAREEEARDSRCRVGLAATAVEEQWGKGWRFFKRRVWSGLCWTNDELNSCSFVTVFAASVSGWGNAWWRSRRCLMNMLLVA